MRWELRGELGGIGELEGELGGRRELGGEGVFGGGEQRVKYLRKCVLKHIAAYNSFAEILDSGDWEV